MSGIDKDIRDLLAAAREAIAVLRTNAERLEVQGFDSTAEREAVRKLNMALQLVEYDVLSVEERNNQWDWRNL